MLLIIAMGHALAVYLVQPGQPALHRSSIATAYMGLIFLAAALIIGPLNTLRGVSNPLSSGDFVQYFVHREPGGVGAVRFDAFGIANHLGLIAELIIVVLLSISNNVSLRTFGPRRWKSIQRHGLVYQAVEHRRSAFVASFVIIVAAAGIMQCLGFLQRRDRLARQRGSRGPDRRQPSSSEHQRRRHNDQI
jgi:sulfoxide reductase heme-binding subunit YedZ